MIFKEAQDRGQHRPVIGRCPQIGCRKSGQREQTIGSRTVFQCPGQGRKSSRSGKIILIRTAFICHDVHTGYRRPMEPIQ